MAAISVDGAQAGQQIAARLQLRSRRRVQPPQTAARRVSGGIRTLTRSGMLK